MRVRQLFDEAFWSAMKEAIGLIMLPSKNNRIGFWVAGGGDLSLAARFRSRCEGDMPMGMINTQAIRGRRFEALRFRSLTWASGIGVVGYNPR